MAIEVKEDKRRIVRNSLKTDKDITFLTEVERWGGDDTTKISIRYALSLDDTTVELRDNEYNALLDAMIKAKEEFGL